MEYRTYWEEPMITYSFISRYGKPARWRWCLRYFEGSPVFNDYDTYEEATKYIKDCILTRNWVYYAR